MKTGTVKSYSELSRYGFITVDGGYMSAEGFMAKDLFVHESGLTYRIQTGDAVTFEITQGKKGLMATNVKRV
jgi:CspA family cold shock protein